MSAGASAWRLSLDPATCERVALLQARFPSLQVSTSDNAVAPCQLKLSDNAITLFLRDEPAWSGICVDFDAGSMAHRRHQPVGGEHVVKAVWGRSRSSPRVIDATGGLGRDMFLLASSGAFVTVVERHPAVALLLADGLWRAQAHEENHDTLARVDFLHASALELLSDRKSEIVYLDPMFPVREKTALVKKEMRAFRLLVGEDPDTDDLFATALAAAEKRVVVKRPSAAPPLLGEIPTESGMRLVKPSHSIDGKANRFDVYAV